MKRRWAFIVLVSIFAFTSCKYDDEDLWNSVQGLENRVAKLEELCKQMNTNISSLQTLVTALQKNDYVTDVTPIMKDNQEIGYTITFGKGNTISIYHGKNGQNGDKGATPVIGVKQDADGLYYWTLNGEWLTDQATGAKIKAQGIDGQDGSVGESGITPKLKIENGYWFISYNNGESWEQLGKATGENGSNGDSMFSGIDNETSTDYIIFTLLDGTQIKLPTWSAFEALQRLCNETNTNLSALQTIVTALQDNDYITGVDPLTEDGKIVGYTIKFAKNNPIVIYNGKDGINGNTPEIGVKMDSDGIYYWTLNGEFIVVEGQKVKAQGTDGNKGSDGQDGITPKLEIREGYWWISYDNGESWEQLGKATGEDGQDGTNIEITQDENNVYFKLPDGSIITISKTGGSGNSDIIQFADKNTKKICVGLWDSDGDSELSYQEAAAVTTLGTVFKDNAEIEFFNELQFFTGLTALEANAFAKCTNLWSLTIPTNVEEIQPCAFQGCSNLMTVTFKENSKLKIIGGGHEETSSLGAFGSCINLRFITIPASVERIDAAAFFNCKNLESVIFEAGSHLKVIAGEYAYSNGSCYAFGAFAYCSSLKSICLPASLETIGCAAFKGCVALTTINFEANSRLSNIQGFCYEMAPCDAAMGAFTDCTSLEKICIPANVTTIGIAAFKGCKSLTEVSFEKNSKLMTIGGIQGYQYRYGAFAECSNLVCFDASNCYSLNGIRRDAFYNDVKLTMIKIGASTPPNCDFGAFENIGSSVILYVPSESVEAYKNAARWKDFPRISAL